MRTAMVLLTLLLIPAALLAAGLQTAQLSDGTEYLVDRFIVTTAPGIPALETETMVSGTAYTGVIPIDNYCAQYDVTRIEPFYDGPVKSVGLKNIVPRMYIFHVAAGTEVNTAQTAFKDLPEIEFSDLYDIPKPVYTPNDPSRTSQWHIAKVQAYQAWDVIRGDATRTAIISIVDTGVYWMHPDLAANMWVNEPEDLNGNGQLDSGDLNGLDDDGNGYVDDVIGWDNGHNDNDPREETPTHGTHVAGCASEVTDNGYMGAGLGFSARLMANKGANSNNQLTAVYQAMTWATENGAHIINCSWGSTYYNSGYQNLINGIHASGVMVIAAAGNENNSNFFYPASYNNVFAVAATSQNDTKASFSSYGSYVDISAPGVAIPSTWATSSWDALSGTSMASPITAGLAGLLKAANPSWGPDDIADVIMASADDIDDLNPSYRGQLGAGRINAYAALASLSSPNLQPSDIAITITNDDGDGILNPGESASMVVTLENIWADASNVTATLRDSDEFSVGDSSASYGNIMSGESSDNSDSPFTLTAGSAVPPGIYSLSLHITADDYMVDVDIDVELSLDQTGFPIDINGNIESSPLIFDFDRDGANEIIVGASSNMVYAFEADGSNCAGWPKATTDDVLGAPAVGDLAGNGTNQVVAVSKDGKIYAWNSNGTLMPNFPVDKGGLSYSAPMLIDMDGNGDLELVFGSFSDSKIYALNHDGSDFSGWPFTDAGRLYSSPTSGDIDGDNKSEIIYGDFDGNVHVLNEDGSEVSGFPVLLNNPIWASISTGDVDGDNHPELAAVTSSGSFYLINHDGTIVSGFPVEIGVAVRSSPSMADLDADGTPEILMGGNDSRLHVFDADGSYFHGFPQQTGGSITPSPVVGDITGDGQPDIIVPAGNGMIYGYDTNGNVLPNFPIPTSTSTQITATAALGDLDHDGDMEIGVGLRTTEGNLIVIDYKADASPSDLQWYSFGRDSRNSGDFSSIITSADDVPVKPFAFGLSQNYPNPFNANTTIQFSLGVPGEIDLAVFDLLGRKIATIYSGGMNAGTHSMIWDGSNSSGRVVASGVYFYRLQSSEGSQTMRMLLLK